MGYQRLCYALFLRTKLRSEPIHFVMVLTESRKYINYLHAALILLFHKSTFQRKGALLVFSSLHRNHDAIQTGTSTYANRWSDHPKTGARKPKYARVSSKTRLSARKRLRDIDLE